MATLQEILARAQALREETALGSIDPERAGSIMYDTLQVINQMQLNGGALVITKIYASVAAMEADDAPVSDLTGNALKPGQLVVIVTTDTSSSDFGSVYRFDGIEDSASTWSFTGKIGGYPMDETPTEGSTRAVTSGGVYSAVSQLAQEATKGYTSTQLTPTALVKLQIDPVNNIFKSTTSGSVRLYYVPCTTGQKFRVTATGSSSAVFRAAYSAAVPAADGALTVLFNENLSAVDFIAEAPADGYFSVYCNATTFPNVKIYSVVYTDLYDQIVQNSANIAANKADADAKIAGLSGQILACVRLVGAGTTLVVSENQTSIIEGHTYRFYLKNWPFGQGGSYHVFEVVAVDSNNVETVLVYERGDSLTPRDYYEAVIPSGTVAIKIKGRVASSYTGECYIQDVTALYNKSTHLKICILGNSYSADAWRYVPLMLLDYGITCEIDFYYRGSGSLHDLDAQWLSDSGTDISYEDGNQHSRFHFTVDSRNFPLGYKWLLTTRMSAHDIVALKQWDIITLQQRGNGGYSADIQYYEPYLQEVIEKIFAQCNYPVNLWWFNSYNGVNDDGTAMNEASIQTQGEVFHSYPFDCVIPAGTAVFDARLNPTLAALGDSGKMMASDGIHLQEGLPCYVAALTVVQAILDKYKPGKSVFGNTFRATAENIANCGMDQTVNGDSTGVTDANCLLAQKAAIVARNSPFNIIGI